MSIPNVTRAIKLCFAVKSAEFVPLQIPMFYFTTFWTRGFSLPKAVYLSQKTLCNMTMLKIKYEQTRTELRKN